MNHTVSVINMSSFIYLYFLGAAAASRMYVDAISKLARQAQQGTWGGSSDIGKQIALQQLQFSQKVKFAHVEFCSFRISVIV